MRNMRNKLLTTYIGIIAILCIGAHAWAAPPTLQSQSACLMDADTGTILFEQNAQTQLSPASTTKVMTALVVLEYGNLDDTVTATAEAIDAVDPDSTRVGFEPGEQLTMETLMYCMMLDSANDAANILAEHVGGSLDGFIALMNRKAEELGCTRTHFANPSGLDAEGHYSCARDMARIVYAANQYPEFAMYAGALRYTLPTDNVISEQWEVYTKVNMLRPADASYDARVYAGKTGWTTQAQNTFAACAKTDDIHLIVTVMNCPVKSGLFDDTTALLDYGEQAYERVKVTPENYRAAAQTAAESVPCGIDIDALPNFSLHLPIGMGADDLRYACGIPQDGNTYLSVSIAEECRSQYQSVTALDGTLPLLRLPVTLTDLQASQGDGGEAVDWAARVNGLSYTTRQVLLVVVVVIGAMLLLGVISLVLACHRRIRRQARDKTGGRK